MELGVSVYGRALIFPLPRTNELLWYSERSGRGHLYLYDLETGGLKRAVTRGAWQVRNVLGVDASRLEKAEASLPEWWSWPGPVQLKAADNKTDIHGLLFKPAGYDPAQTYCSSIPAIRAGNGRG